MTAQAAEIVYNQLASPFSDILEQLGCVHKDTVDDIEEWEKSKDNGSNEITVNYLTGEVIVTRYNSNRSFDGKKTFTLNGRGPMEQAARAAVAA